MKVVDTNVIAYFFIEGVHTKNTRVLFEEDSFWIAPILWRSEFRNILTLYLRKNYINTFQMREIMRKAEELLNGNEYHIPSNQIFDLAENSTCSAYDCEFVALARDIGEKLITSDKKILKEFPDYTKSLLDYT
jgi:predicted nucleic acid-binding protein